MRILALTNLYPSPWQPGRAPFNRQQFHALVARHELRVIAPVAWRDELAVRWKGTVQAPKRYTVIDGISVDYPRYIYPPKILRNWYGHFFRASARVSFNNALREFRPDVVYGSWAYPDGWAAVHLAREAGLPVVMKVHGSDIHLLDQYPARKQRTCEALCAADAVMTPSKDLARRVIELGADPGRVHHIYNGVDTSLFHPGNRTEARHRLGLPQDEPIVLFVGNLVPIKGIDVLIAACARLKADQMRFSCRLIGEGRLMPQLQRQIRDRGLTSCVELLGSRPHVQLPDWYRSANVLVLPSHSEGVPNVLLEAAACGTRFVASDVGGVREIAHLASGKFVPPGDVTSLADVIRNELNHPTAGTVESPMPMRSFDESAAELSAILEQVVEAHAHRNQRSLAGSLAMPVGESR